MGEKDKVIKLQNMVPLGFDMIVGPFEVLGLVQTDDPTKFLGVFRPIHDAPNDPEVKKEFENG